MQCRLDWGGGGGVFSCCATPTFNKKKIDLFSQEISKSFFMYLFKTISNVIHTNLNNRCRSAPKSRMSELITLFIINVP